MRGKMKKSGERVIILYGEIIDCPAAASEARDGRQIAPFVM